MQKTADFLSGISHPLASDSDLDVLLDKIGEARFVLLGEASHGTHEYYTWRARISKRLIEEKGFSAIAVEGDWPDCYSLNRYVRWAPDAGNSAREVLSGFNRWPTWMWANWETAALGEWMRQHNAGLAGRQQAGFYGLDVYSLWESMEEVFVYLKGKDPVAYQAARKAMQCFEPFNVREGFSYAERSYGMSSSCRNEVVDLLAKIRTRMPVFDTDFESIFNAEQNALVAVNAERYYHAMLDSGASTWNIRDRHMTETAERLREFLGPDAKLAIWEHNTHIGDARATSMKRSGLVNIGQLLMEKYGPEDVFRVGFGSYGGTVVAAKEWGAEMEKMRVPDAREDSWEWMLHQDGRNKLVFSEDFAGFTQNIGHRAIGVVYDPDFEYGNYVPSVIPERYEAFAFIDRTSALHPMRVRPDGMQMPETYPWGV